MGYDCHCRGSLSGRAIQYAFHSRIGFHDFLGGSDRQCRNRAVLLMDLHAQLFVGGASAEPGVADGVKDVVMIAPDPPAQIQGWRTNPASGFYSQ